MRGDHASGLCGEQSSQDRGPPLLHVARQLRGHRAERTGQDVGEDEVVGRPCRAGGCHPAAIRHCTLPRRPLAVAFSRATLTDQASMSVAMTGLCSSEAAAIARMPDPQPRSRIRRGRRCATPSSARRQPRVELCSPDPKATPASSTRVIRPGTEATGRWVPRMAKRRPTRCSGNDDCVRASQPPASVGLRCSATSSPVMRPARARPDASSASPWPRSLTPSIVHTGSSRRSETDRRCGTRGGRRPRTVPGRPRIR